MLLDALGTLLTFEPPAPHLRAALLERTGVDIGEAARAGRDPRRDRLLPRASARGRPTPRRCTTCASAAPRRCACPSRTTSSVDALLASLRFHAYPDSAPALRALREPGIRTVVVSNWDFSLHERLRETGLAAARRRRGRVRRGRLGQARRRDLRAPRWSSPAPTPRDAWHVGDTPEADVEGARAAGIRPILIARERPRRRRRRATVRSLAELIPLLGDLITDAEIPPPSAAAGAAEPSVPVWVPFVALLAVADHRQHRSALAVYGVARPSTRRSRAPTTCRWRAPRR